MKAAKLNKNLQDITVFVGCRFPTALVKDIFSRLFCCRFFEVVIFPMPSNEVMTVMFLGINIFWLGLGFGPFSQSSF